MREPIANHKTIYSNMAPEGWAYTGFDNGHYLFQTGSYQIGFKEMKCIEEDLTPKNLALMVKLGVTR